MKQNECPLTLALTIVGGKWKPINCTGCQVCVPFCPVDCIEPVAKDKYDIPIPPVQVRFDECTGCQVCARVCTRMTWDAIRMLKTDDFEENFDLKIK